MTRPPVNRTTLCAWVAALVFTGAASRAATVVFPVEVASTAWRDNPMEMDIDFASVITTAKVQGVLDPSAMEVTNLATAWSEPAVMQPGLNRVTIRAKGALTMPC
jgi:hypothetical protein